MTWLRRVLRRRPSDRDVDAELRDHLERLADDYRQQGMTSDHALRQARLAFGGDTGIREACREARTRHQVDRVVRWARDVLRATRRDPLVTVVCVVTLALGIGSTTAMATLVDAVLLRPLPYAHADRMVELWTASTTDPSDKRPGMGTAGLPEISQTLSDVFDHVEAYQYGTATLTGDGEPVNITAPRISAGLLAMLGIVPRKGRLLGAGDSSDTRHIVISERLWIDRFGGAESVLGSTLTLDDEPHTIIGVMPYRLQFPWQPAAIWRPTSDERAAGRAYVIATLREDVPRTVAVSRLAILSLRLREENRLDAADQLVMTDIVQARQARRYSTALLAMLGAASLVLLVACINVSSLLLARASTREGEIALRSALGAARRTLASRMLGEGILLALAGGAGGVALAQLVIVPLLLGVPDGVRFVSTESMRPANLLAWGLAASMFTAVGVSLIPMVRVGRPGLSQVITGAAPATSAARDNAWQSTLVVAQLAAVLIVLTGAGLLLRSFVTLTSVNPGFDASNLLVTNIQLPRHRYTTGEARLTFMRDVTERMSSLGGVRSATYAEGAPPTGGAFAPDAPIEVDGVPRERLSELPTLTVTPAYFTTIGIPIVQGRTFASDDSDYSVIVSRAFASRYWGGTSPIGRRLTWNTDLPAHTVVGVADDAKQGGLDDELGQGLAVYTPFRADPWPFFAVLVRTDGHGPSKRALRDVVSALDPSLPVVSVETMDERLAESVARQRFFAWLATSSAAMAVLMTSVGVFGNAAYWVARRRRELALRLAVGASPRAIRRFVLVRCLRLALLGTVVGLVGAVGTARLLESLLFGIHRYDAWTFAGVVVLLALIVVFAAYLPARRASRLDPWRILQSQ